MSNRTKNILMVAIVVGGMAYDAHERGRMTADTSDPRAVAYHGAMSLYRTLAVFFGNRALEAERSYWDAVKIR